MGTPVMNLPFSALAGILGAESTERFFSEWWERSPKLVPARTATERESFRRSDWRSLAHAARSLKESTVEVILGGRPSAPSSDQAIDEAFNAGASVRVIRVQRVWPYLDELCRALQWELGFRISANLYVTPEGRQGLDVHADSHDVLVVQMTGRKDWEIYGSPYRLPVDYRAPMVFEENTRRDHRGDGFGGRGYQGQDLGPPLVSCSLSAGDLLYVPRGFVHQAAASHGTSAHVTIGIHATTWGDLLALAAAQESRMEPSLRETLPPGFTRVAASRAFVENELRKRAGRLLERVHGEALMIETASRFGASENPSAPPGPEDGDQNMEREAPPTPPEEMASLPESPGSEYRLAPHAHIMFREDGVDIRSLRKSGLPHSFPTAMTPLFEALAMGKSLRPDAAAPLTPRSGRTFAARLLRDGLLDPVE